MMSRTICLGRVVMLLLSAGLCDFSLGFVSSGYQPRSLPGGQGATGGVGEASLDAAKSKEESKAERGTWIHWTAGVAALLSLAPLLAGRKTPRFRSRRLINVGCRAFDFLPCGKKADKDYKDAMANLGKKYKARLQQEISVLKKAQEDALAVMSKKYEARLAEVVADCESEIKTLKEAHEAANVSDSTLKIAQLQEERKVGPAATKAELPKKTRVAASTKEPGTLPASFEVGDFVYYVDANSQYISRRGQLGIVTGRIGTTVEGTARVVVSFGNGRTEDCLPQQLSREKPGPLLIPGGYKAKDSVFFVGPRMTFEGCTLRYGQEGQVQGPGAGKWAGQVEVLFQRDRRDEKFYVPPEHLSSTTPKPLPGGYKVDQRVYYIGDSEFLAHCGKSTYGELGTVQGPGTGESAGLLQVSFSTRYALCDFRLLSPGDLFQQPPCIPGGFKPWDIVYSLVETVESGSKVTYGQPGTVRGPGTGEQAGLVAVTFKGNQKKILCHPEALVQEEPGELPGGFQVGDIVFFAATSETLKNGEQVTFRQRGTVRGQRMGSSERWVMVFFEGNHSNVHCLPEKLSRTDPELAREFKVGDRIFYTKTSVELKTMCRDKLTYGQQGTVRDPQAGLTTGLVTVFFEGNEEDVQCHFEHLSHKEPGPLPGGYKAWDTVYWAAARRHVGYDSPRYGTGERVIKYRSRGTVVGPSHGTSADCVDVLFEDGSLGEDFHGIASCPLELLYKQKYTEGTYY